MDVVELVKSAGVVGAGGAGFPTHIKLNCKAAIVIANGAECEPLLRVDQTLMQTQADRIVSGMEAAMSAVSAKLGVIATKSHYHEAVQALKRAIGDKKHIRLHLMKSYYPAGDEKSLIYDITERVVPSAKLPLDVNCVVVNVATLTNIADAMEGKPVTDKYVTIGGDVANPVTLCVPIGTPIKPLLKHAGFEGGEQEYALIIGGPCMGRLEENWNAPVTKTTGGILVFKRSHPLIVQQTMPLERQAKLAQAVCCQCSQCTQLCPRNALGLNVQPHKVMRAAAMGDAKLIGDVNGLLACSSCGLCTNYACNFGLQPSAMMTEFKTKLLKAGVRPKPEENIVPDSALRLKRVPTSRLIARMGLSDYDVPAPLMSGQVETKRVIITLQMHAGKPAEPVVAVGDTVNRGDLLGQIPEKALGAAVHASISGKVARIARGCIEIKA
jgi:RnfABCDGE-type electron transport complex C subunit